MASQPCLSSVPTQGLAYAAHAQVFDEDAGIMVDCDMLINYHAKRGGNIDWSIPGDDFTLSHINGVPC